MQKQKKKACTFIWKITKLNKSNKKSFFYQIRLIEEQSNKLNEAILTIVTSLFILWFIIKIIGKEVIKVNEKVEKNKKHKY